MIITEGSSYIYNITHFDPNDPVIVSETEIYCSTDCCVRAVIKEEIEYDWLFIESNTNQLMPAVKYHEEHLWVCVYVMFCFVNISDTASGGKYIIMIFIL